MAKTKREYILATCVLSGAAAILSFVALGTQEWIVSDVLPVDGTNSDVSTLHFGLFGGVLNQASPVVATYELSVICLIDKNVCALLCGNSDQMYEDLESLYNGEVVSYDSDTCPKIVTENQPRRVFFPGRPRDAISDRTYMNTGIWVSTIIFLIISALLGVISSGLAVWNTAASPYQVYFSVFGLYIYNAIALFTSLLVLILWGAMYAQTLRGYIPIYQTLNGDFTTQDLAQLGYSYWIILGSSLLYAISISLLYIRNYLISKEPEVNVHLEDNSDPGIYLY